MSNMLQLPSKIKDIHMYMDVGVCLFLIFFTSCYYISSTSGNWDSFIHEIEHLIGRPDVCV